MVMESVRRSLTGSGKQALAGSGKPVIIGQLETLAANLRNTGPQLELSHKVRTEKWEERDLLRFSFSDRSLSQGFLVGLSLRLVHAKMIFIYFFLFSS